MGVLSATMYCLKCDYILDGLKRNECPECGRTFYREVPGTYRRKHSKRFLRPIILSALVVGILGATAWGIWSKVQVQSEQEIRIRHEKALESLRWMGADDFPLVGRGVWWGHIRLVDERRRHERDLTDKEMKNLASTLADFNRPILLDLQGKTVSAQGLAAVNGLENLDGLVADTLTDDMLRQFANQSVRFIDLSISTITDKSLSLLSKLESLEFLVVENTCLTRDGMNALRAARPDLVVIDDFGYETDQTGGPFQYRRKSGDGLELEYTHKMMATVKVRKVVDGKEDWQHECAKLGQDWHLDCHGPGKVVSFVRHQDCVVVRAWSRYGRFFEMIDWQTGRQLGRWDY